jgi:hypothetical protein
MKSLEYHEGPEALKNFEKTMTTLFRALKTPANPRVKPLNPPKSPLTRSASITSPHKILGIVVSLKPV